MQVTRNHHARHMARLSPILLALYILQAILYQKFAPSELAQDINLFLGFGLAMIIGLYHFYDHHHKIICRENFLEVRFDVLKIKEEILYRNILHVEIKKRPHNYAHMILHLHDGSFCHLHHVDSPELLAEFIDKKKFRKSWAA